VADATRKALVEARRPFIAETVLSHPSELELIDTAQVAGYTVIVQVLLVPEELSVARVAHRVAARGHSVPEENATTAYDDSDNSGPRIRHCWVSRPARACGRSRRGRGRAPRGARGARR
jgi:predicted ABC-type ATPase